jgi:hypothetical protein
MKFDWDLLRPEQELTEVQKSLVREIGETFLTTGTGIPDHQKKVQLGKNRNLLTGLVQLGLIRSNWNRYYPTFSALYFLPPALRDSYAGILHLIFKAIKALYESAGPQRFSFQRIEEQFNVLIIQKQTFGTGSDHKPGCICPESDAVSARVPTVSICPGIQQPGHPCRRSHRHRKHAGL